MDIFYASLSAFFAGLTTILAKIGLKNINSNLVTALRCSIVIIFSSLIIFLNNSYVEIFTISNKTWLFLILSGFSTGLSWILYFKALSIGDVNKIAPIDSSSVVMTIIFSWILLGETFSTRKFLAMLLIFIGVLLMINRKDTKIGSSKLGLLYAFLSAIFASLSAIFGKVGIAGVDSTLGTTIRVFVVLIFSWLIVGVKKDYKHFGEIPRRSIMFVFFSGVTTGLSWLAFYKAMQIGNVSSVIVIDKLSILVAMLFSAMFLKEKFTARTITGLVILVVGVVTLIRN